MADKDSDNHRPRRGLVNPHAAKRASSETRRTTNVHEDRRTHISEPRWQVVVSIGVAGLGFILYLILLFFSSHD